MCLLRGTDWVFIYNSTFCPHSVFMCFVWIWEQTAIISLYSINWLVFITETQCVYCAIRTGSLYIILRSAHTVHLCVLCGSENKQRLFPYTALTDWFFITETDCVYCVVRTGSLNKAVCALSLTGLSSLLLLKIRSLKQMVINIKIQIPSGLNKTKFCNV